MKAKVHGHAARQGCAWAAALRDRVGSSPRVTRFRTMPEPIGRREQNRRERRRRLEDSALALFERDGYDATTIEHIAAAAGLAPRTFFSYFASKDDLVVADYAQRLDRILRELGAQPADLTAWDALQRAFAAVAVDYEEQADRIRRRFQIMVTNPSVMARSLQLQAGWEVAVAAALRTRSGVPEHDVMAPLLAASALAVMRASVQRWLTAGESLVLPELVEAGFRRLGDGLGDL